MMNIARTTEEKRALLAPLGLFDDGVVVLWPNGSYAYSSLAIGIGLDVIDSNKWCLALPKPGGWPGQEEAVNAYCDTVRKDMEERGYD